MNCHGQAVVLEKAVPLRYRGADSNGADGATMTGKPSRKEDARKAREERLAAALRENLKKRKAQARARNGAGEDAPPGEG